MQASAAQRKPICALLKDQPEVVILNEQDSFTALVEMSDRAVARIKQLFPKLIVEPNLSYKHHSN